MADEEPTTDDDDPPDYSGWLGRFRKAGDYLQVYWKALSLIEQLEKNQNVLTKAVSMQQRAIEDLKRDLTLYRSEFVHEATAAAREEARATTAHLVEQNAQLRERLAVIEAELKRDRA